MVRHPLARRRDKRLRKVTSATVKRDLVLLGHVFEVAHKEWGIYVQNPVRDIKLPPGGRPPICRTPRMARRGPCLCR
jgi:hypothetical protein